MSTFSAWGLQFCGDTIVSQSPVQHVRNLDDKVDLGLECSAQDLAFRVIVPLSR